MHAQLYVLQSCMEFVWLLTKVPVTVDCYSAHALSTSCLADHNANVDCLRA